jgi:glycine oxidase
MGPRVSVTGGGIIGLSIAWRLAQRGADVTVFEARRLGRESSWAGAGMLAPGGELNGRSRLTDLALESLGLYPEFVDELYRESGVAIEFRPCGAFSLAYSSGEAEDLKTLAETQNQLGIYSEQFHPARVPGVRAGAVAAQYYPNDSVVNPRDLVRALIEVCRRAGVELREGEPTAEIAESPEFDASVLAAGAWSRQVRVSIAGLTQSIPETFPVRGHLVAFDVTDRSLADVILRHNHTYLLRRSENSVIAGATSEQCGFDRSIDDAAAGQLARSAVELMPALSGRAYTTWNGFRPATADGLPVIERVAGSSIWLAYGHYRNGILLAPVTAQMIAAQITG